MNNFFLTILIPALAGVFGVIVGSLKPILDWNIEKRRLRRQQRMEILRATRDYIENVEPFDRFKFRDTSFYAQLHQHLSKTMIEKLKTPYNNLTVIVDTDRTYVTNFKTDLLSELAELEKTWRLI